MRRKRKRLESLLTDPPRRGRRPILQFRSSPFRGLVGVTRGAGVWDAGLLCLSGSDEAECMCGDVVIFDRLLDVRHVAGGTLTSGASFCMVRMLRDGALQSGWILLCMAGQAKLIAGNWQVRRGVAVDLMAVEAA